MHKILGLALASVLGAASIALTQPALAQNQITINGGAPCNWSSYSVTSNGNYNFTASGSCGSGTVPAPVCSTAPSVTPSATIVANTAATLTVSCTNGPISYTWIPSGANSAGGPVVSGITANTTGALTFTTAGTFSYTVTATNGSGTSSASPPVTITVTQPPTAAPTCTNVSQTTVSAGNSATLTATCDQTPNSYVWTPTNGGPAIPTSASGTVGVLFPTAGTFNYTVTASNAGFGAGTAFPFTVTVGAMVVPTCTVTANPTTIPSGGGSTTLTATCTSSPTGYSWSPSAGAPGVTGSGAIVSASFPSGTAAATYTYTVTASNGAGAGSPVGANVTVQPPAAAGCVVKDKASLFPAWVAGNAYNTANAPLNVQPPNETWAFKFLASDLLNSGPNSASAVQIYEGGNPMFTFSLSTTPCGLVDTAPTIVCQRSGNSGSLGMSFVASTHSASDAQVTSAGYCRAQASTEYYVNVKFAGPPNVLNPTASTCTLAGGCSYYLLYQKVY